MEYPIKAPVWMLNCINVIIWTSVIGILYALREQITMGVSNPVIGVMLYSLFIVGIGASVYGLIALFYGDVKSLKVYINKFLIEKAN